MNGYVLAWMALSSGPSAAAGILIGRRMQHWESHAMGWEDRGRDDEINARRQANAEQSRVIEASTERWQRMMAGMPVDQPEPGRASTHDHDGPCSRERGCY